MALGFIYGRKLKPIFNYSNRCFYLGLPQVRAATDLLGDNVLAKLLLRGEFPAHCLEQSSSWDRPSLAGSHEWQLQQQLVDERC